MLPSVSMLKRTMTGGGGLEKWMEMLTKAFASKGCPVRVISSDPCTFDSPLIETKQIKTLAPFTYQKINGFDREAAKYLNRNPTDIVFGLDRNRKQTHYRAGNGVHKAFLERRTHIDSTWKTRSFALNPLHRSLLSLEKAAFENSHLKTIFTNSNMVCKEILHYYNVPEEKIVVVHNGVEWSRYAKNFSLWVERKGKIARELSLDPAVFHFLFIGNGYRRKGLDLLLNALAALPDRAFHLSVIGRDKNLDKAIALAASLGLGDKVSFYGERRDVHSFYQLADCLVIPSHYDPFANVTVEALAMGLTVVSSPYNGGSEILTPETGIVLPNLEEKEAFVDALNRAMLMPKTWMRSGQIRESVKHLDMPHQIGKIIDRTLA